MAPSMFNAGEIFTAVIEVMMFCVTFLIPLGLAFYAFGKALER